MNCQALINHQPWSWDMTIAGIRFAIWYNLRAGLYLGQFGYRGIESFTSATKSVLQDNLVLKCKNSEKNTCCYSGYIMQSGKFLCYVIYIFLAISIQLNRATSCLNAVSCSVETAVPKNKVLHYHTDTKHWMSNKSIWDYVTWYIVVMNLIWYMSYYFFNILWHVLTQISKS